MTGPRIGIFYRDFLDPGGIPRETELLANAMDAAGASVVVYCYEGAPGQKLRRMESSGVILRVINFSTNRNALFVPRQFARLLRENADDLDMMILIGAFIMENAPVARMLRMRGLPYIFSPGDVQGPAIWHGRGRLLKRAYDHLFERRILGRSSGIRLYSWDQLRRLETRYQGYDGQYFVAKEGIDREDLLESLSNDATSASPLPRTPLTFGYLGRLDVYPKGLDTLMEAWADYKRDDRPGKLVIAGPSKPEERATLRALAHDLELRDYELRGPSYGVKKYHLLSEFSVLVHASRHDGIPRVIREALAMGCPVVVTPATNLADVVDRYGAGWVTEGNRGSVCDALQRVAACYPGHGSYQKGALAAADSLDWNLIGSAFVEEICRRLALH